MGVEQVAPFARQRQAAVAVAKVNHIDESLIAQMFDGVVVGIEVMLGHDAKSTDGGQGAAIVAVQLVDAVAVDDQFALVAAWQVEVAHQAIARISTVSIAVLMHSRTAFAAFTVARVISRIEHGCPPDMALR